MRNRQQGMTAIGMLVLAAILGLVGFAALRLTPIYLEHMKVLQILSDVKVELDGQETSLARLRASIENRLNIESVYGLKVKDFKITKTSVGGGYVVQAKYDRRTNYVANIYLLAEFDDTVEILR
ncbi:MAG: DUF4845 domain-containing protein [Gammaproteobacteria bacterium]|jgi:hypothetical protein